IHAAAVQLRAHSRASFAAAWPAITQHVEAAAASGAGIVVLPEGTLPAYVLGYDRYEPSEIEAALEQCAAIARRYGVVLVAGAARREGDRVFNSAVVIERDGSIAGSADKHFLWHFDRQWYAPGERIEPIRTSIGCIGALVCADGRIPTIARALVDAGAEILVMPTAWVTSGRDPQQMENAQADLLARVRARENGVPFIAANKCGVERGCVAYCGKSQIVAADGMPIVVASQDREETIFATLDVGAPAPQRRPYEPMGVSIPGESRACRLAITARSPHPDDEELLRILEADALIYADEIAPLGTIDGIVFTVTDGMVLDPGVLAEMRVSGDLQLAVWRTSYDPSWQVTFARARALELRMYVIVIDTAHDRAYAVDPDGAVVCGTFGEYRVASFTFDPAKTRQTAVAPGTDVLQGLQRARSHAR
ncbi:MAG TPA: carbon-nitrogen hydrolase family protein, partial [Candidatus Baltobacteraceae bacterium]|nr:carbon-nitrogen hydrolase family protein [Candidatus Baltobacteraceae bacterium]